MVLLHLLFPCIDCGFDLSNVNQSEDVVMSLSKSSHTIEKNLPISSKVRIKKWNYDASRKFQDKWTSKVPWVELFIRENGSLHIIKCRICNKLKRKDELLVSRWDSLCKHKKDNKNMGFNVKKRTSIIPNFVNMPRTKDFCFPQSRICWCSISTWGG
jgi:hypothetical protein